MRQAQQSDEIPKELMEALAEPPAHARDPSARAGIDTIHRGQELHRAEEVPLLVQAEGR